jgi:hypothetical protein
MHFGRTTLSKFLIQQSERAEGASDLAALLIDVAAAVKAISAMTAKGALGGVLSKVSNSATHADTQVIRLDLLASDEMLRSCEWGGLVAGMASEELDAPYAVPAEFARGRQCLGRHHLLGAEARQVGGAIPGRLPATRQPAGRGRVRDLRPGDHAGDHGGQGHARLHAGS